MEKSTQSILDLLPSKDELKTLIKENKQTLPFITNKKELKGLIGTVHKFENTSVSHVAKTKKFSVLTIK